MTISQDAFRFYEDGTETGATPLAAQNVDIEKYDEDVFLYRFLLQDTGGTTLSKGGTVSYSLNGGAYTGITASTPVQTATSSNVAQNDDTTSQLGGTGTFITDNDAVTEGTNAALPASFAFASGERTEVLIVLALDSAQLSDDDTVDIKLAQENSGPEVGRITWTSGTPSTRRRIVIT